MKMVRPACWAAMLIAACSRSAPPAALPAPSPVGQSTNDLAYFLSASLPEQDVAMLIRAAEHRHIPVYFRGLLGDSLEQTAGYIRHMVSTYHIRGIYIDPVRFAQYGVTQVPALVKKCGDRVDIIYGNIALNQALELLSERGECRVQDRAGP